MYYVRSVPEISEDSVSSHGSEETYSEISDSEISQCIEESLGKVDSCENTNSTKEYVDMNSPKENVIIIMSNNY